MGLPDLVKACDLFVYLNVQLRSFQFEEEEIFIIVSAQYPGSIKLCGGTLGLFGHQYCIALVFQFAHLLVMTKDPLNLKDSYIYTSCLNHSQDLFFGTGSFSCPDWFVWMICICFVWRNIWTQIDWSRRFWTSFPGFSRFVCAVLSSAVSYDRQKSGAWNFHHVLI